MGKWSVKVYFRGYNDEVRDKYASCFLCRTTEDSAPGEQTTFASQIFMDFGNSNDKSKRRVYSHPKGTVMGGGGALLHALHHQHSGERIQSRLGSCFTSSQVTVFE